MTSIKTLNPLEMTVASPEEDGNVTTAGHFLHDVEICPSCKGPMKKLTVGRRANPVESWTCIRDRISLPLKND